MVDFASIPPGMRMDARDTQRLSDLLAPLLSRALAFDQAFPFSLGVRAVMPGQQVEPFRAILADWQAKLMEIGRLNEQAQEIVAAFVPQHPMRPIAAPVDDEVGAV